MPYLRVTSPRVDASQRRAIAVRLTDAIVEIFFDPRARLTQDELRERTTIHFFMYGEDDIFTGAQTPQQRGTPDVTVELSDWSMSIRKQRRVARHLTPVIAELFDIGHQQLESVNIRFHSYPPTDFAVGGKAAQ